MPKNVIKTFSSKEERGSGGGPWIGDSGDWEERDEARCSRTYPCKILGGIDRTKVYSASAFGAASTSISTSITGSPVAPGAEIENAGEWAAFKPPPDAIEGDGVRRPCTDASMSAVELEASFESESDGVACCAGLRENRPKTIVSWAQNL